MTTRKLFKDKETEKVWNRIFVKKWNKELQRRTWEELTTLFAFADNLKKLKRYLVQQLKGKRKGQHSIRINDQFRICFIWEKGKVCRLELVDYHNEKR